MRQNHKHAAAATQGDHAAGGLALGFDQLARMSADTIAPTRHARHAVYTGTITPGHQAREPDKGICRSLETPKRP